MLSKYLHSCANIVEKSASISAPIKVYKYLFIKLDRHSTTWKTTWYEKYEVRKVEISFTGVILTKLILLDTNTFILICTFTIRISKK